MISNSPHLGQQTAERGQCSNTACMADCAIIVHIRDRAFRKLLAILGLMLMVVMTKVLRRSRFVLAIGRCDRPGNLERQNNQQEIDSQRRMG